MSIELLSVILFSCIFLSLALGIPIPFALGGVGTLFIFALWGKGGLYSLAMNTWGTISHFSFIALPFFIFMACILERSGVGDRLYDTIYKWFGGIKGGLAIGTVMICTAFAAMAGISGAATISMGIIALPSMLNRGYTKTLATGSVQAGGALGVLIPPSITMIIIGLLATISVGRLYAGGLFPGLILSGVFMTYIAVRSALQPSIAPAIPLDQRVGWDEKFRSLRGVILPILLIVLVLGSILGGLTSVSEAAAMGAFGAMICAAANRRFNWKMLKEACLRSLKLNCFLMWVIIGAQAFSVFYTRTGAIHMIEGIVVGLEVNRWVIVIIMQVILLIMGCMMDTVGIIMITVPIFFPLIRLLGFQATWFGVLFVINTEIGFLTPPFGLNLFYIRSIAPPGLTMDDIYKSVWPFVALFIIGGLALNMIFPQIITFLPNLIFGGVPLK